MGDSVDARLASDLVVGDRRAAKAGASVHGTITQLISGSHKVGGVPTLGITFDSLVANGASVSINAPFTQLAKSDTGKDTAKIVGALRQARSLVTRSPTRMAPWSAACLAAAAGTAAAKRRAVK